MQRRCRGQRLRFSENETSSSMLEDLYNTCSGCLLTNKINMFITFHTLSSELQLMGYYHQPKISYLITGQARVVTLWVVTSAVLGSSLYWQQHYCYETDQH